MYVHFLDLFRMKKMDVSTTANWKYSLFREMADIMKHQTLKL